MGGGLQDGIWDPIKISRTETPTMSSRTAHVTPNGNVREMIYLRVTERRSFMFGCCPANHVCELSPKNSPSSPFFCSTGRVREMFFVQNDMSVARCCVLCVYARSGLCGSQSTHFGVCSNLHSLYGELFARQYL